jgi:hypothetical protein
MSFKKGLNLLHYRRNILQIKNGASVQQDAEI